MLCGAITVDLLQGRSRMDLHRILLDGDHPVSSNSIPPIDVIFQTVRYVDAQLLNSRQTICILKPSHGILKRSHFILKPSQIILKPSHLILKPNLFAFGRCKKEKRRP